MTKQEIQAGLDRWSELMAGAAQFAKYLERKRAGTRPASKPPAPRKKA